MARWKLREAHYIHATRDGNRCEWVYKEINRANGREIQRKFPVPMHLDPKIEIDWTHQPDGNQQDGYIVVALEGTTDRRDVIITEDMVTPGMDPLDDEARVITEKHSRNWQRVDGREDATYSERLLDHYIAQLAEAQSTVANTTAGSVQGLGKVLEAMTAMMEQNQQILQALVTQRVEPKSVGIRRP